MNSATTAATALAVSGAEIIVSTAHQLKTALANATGGETIVLKQGDYGSVGLTGGIDMRAALSAEVTIRSEDPRAPAVFSGLALKDVSNLKFEHVLFDYEAQPGAILSIAAFTLQDVSNVSIVNSEFDGDIARGGDASGNGFGTGYGLRVNGSSNVTIAGNEFSRFHRGAVFSESTDVRVSNNNLYHMSSDGLDFADVDNVLIKGNEIHDFFMSELSSAHPDMIQFWTSGTTSPSTNIKILDNLLYMGKGVYTQSIFIRNELVDSGAAGSEMFYRNIEISGNVIRNAHVHGITVGGTAGLNISNNTILQALTTAETGTAGIPSINVGPGSQLVSVTNNITPTLSLNLLSPVAGWDVGNNLIVQIDNPHAANYAGHLFADPFDSTSITRFDFRPVAGGLADRRGAGALETPGDADAGLAGYIRSHESSSGGAIVQHLDASQVFLNHQLVNLAGADVKWNFGDGTKGSGLSVGHVYSEPGEYLARARIVLDSGDVLFMEKSFSVRSSNYLDIDFQPNFTDRSPFTNTFTVDDASLAVSQSGNGALRLNGGSVAYEANSDFVFNREFSVLADFKKDAGEEAAGGKLIYKSGSFVVSLTGDSATVVINTSEGWVTLGAASLGINDANWHSLGVTFSGDTGKATLYVDGAAVDQEVGLTGAVQIGGVSSDFYIGGPFGDSFGGLVDNVHFLGEDLSAGNMAAANAIAAWERSGARSDAVVAADLLGIESVDLTVTMSDNQIETLFDNAYSNLMSGTDFQIL